MIQNLKISENKGTLQVFDFSSGKLLATLLTKDTIVFTGEIISKETICYINNLFLDFNGYIKIYENGGQDLFGF